MEFVIPQTERRITKDYLLEVNSEETYMSTYLGVPIKKGLQISPLRKDHKPTASFYRNKKGELIFHDFGIGFHGNFVAIVMHIYNLDYSQALRRIAEDFGLTKTRRNDIEPIKIRKTDVVITEKADTQIQIEDQPFSASELTWWESFGIHESTLKKFKVHSCKSIFLNGNYLTSSSSKKMIFGYYGGKKDGLELWRIYQPQNKLFKFMSNWSKSHIQGATQLPACNDVLIIQKSLKDVMCLYEQNIHSIAPCSENSTLGEYQVKRMCIRFNKVYTFFDNDQPGVIGAHKYKKMNPSIKCIFLQRKWAKDISDFHKYHKDLFEDAIEELKNIFKDDSIKKSKYFYVF